MVKKHFLFMMVFVVSVLSGTLRAQVLSDNVKGEITKTLELWNATAKNSDLEKFMTFFDDSENTLMVGSDSGEVFKGKEEIKGWLSQLFGFASFSWEMNRVDIDYNENTAWVFIDGKMVIESKSGKIRKAPYRFTGIMIKKGDVWKWRLFNGSSYKSE
ncbi:MAG: nuclear transport factor 2 family protein [Ignavibacteriota bacterium]